MHTQYMYQSQHSVFCHMSAGACYHNFNRKLQSVKPLCEATAKPWPPGSHFHRVQHPAAIISSLAEWGCETKQLHSYGHKQCGCEVYVSFAYCCCICRQKHMFLQGETSDPSVFVWRISITMKIVFKENNPQETHATVIQTQAMISQSTENFCCVSAVQLVY